MRKLKKKNDNLLENFNIFLILIIIFLQIRLKMADGALLPPLCLIVTVFLTNSFLGGTITFLTLVDVSGIYILKISDLLKSN